MKPFEIHAESVEAAIRIAQKRYDAYEDELDITVLDKGSRGFLGILGVRNAAISCRLKPEFVERKLGSFLKKLLDEFDSEVFFEVALKGKTIRVVLDGNNISRLIGKHGKTVGALQHILAIYANRLSDIKMNVLVEVGNYKTERRRLAEDFAHKAARNALKKGTKISLDPMFSFERKIVHEVISKYNGLKSFSVGLEPYRRVVIEPERKRLKSATNRRS